MKIEFRPTMTERTKELYGQLMQRAQHDRTEEWFQLSMFTKYEQLHGAPYGLPGRMRDQSVLIRRSVALDVMLRAMTDPENSRSTSTAEIHGQDLLLGNLPMGSNGLGKVFPRYLTRAELRAGSIANRNSSSLFGHNTLNYEKLICRGLNAVIQEAQEKQAVAANSLVCVQDSGRDLLALEAAADELLELGSEEDGLPVSMLRQERDFAAQRDFYKSVEISCQSVISYAERFAKIAEGEAECCPEEGRRQELLEMARIARKVPRYSADTFQEALQSITFFHIALHAEMNFISLGRMDQVLAPYLEKERDKNRALELFECFLIKLAWRINLSSDYLIAQDHVDYGTVLGTHPYYVDQKAGVNNFLQNIIIGGKKPDGSDATNACTYLILQAFANVNLSTPGVYVRLHHKSPPALIEYVARTLVTTRNNPAVCNDDVMIPAFHRALMQDAPAGGDSSLEERALALANDYCVDGCWEPLLNGKSDWTFAMFNVMNVWEAAVNQGAKLEPYGPMFRGAKIAPAVDEPGSFEALMSNIRTQMKFFSDQSVISLFLYYMLDEYACPSPLLSSLLDGCMERGRDKSWGGTEYNLGGLIYGGVPNLVNTLVAMRKFVFPEAGQGKYTFVQLREALRADFTSEDPALQALYDSIQIDLNTNSPKFGNGDPEADALTNTILDLCYDAAMSSARFAKQVFQAEIPPKDREKYQALRSIAGYYGLPLSVRFKDFQLKVTVGLGTFEQYHWQGSGSAASADRRRGEPIAPNFSPVPGTNHNGFLGLCSSFSRMEDKLKRFAGGVITDLCLEEHYGDQETVERVLRESIQSGIPMFTLTVGSSEIYAEIYEAVLKAELLEDKEERLKCLEKYAGINVRIGGWQTPFVTLPKIHMLNYIKRPVGPNKKATGEGPGCVDCSCSN